MSTVTIAVAPDGMELTDKQPEIDDAIAQQPRRWPHVPLATRLQLFCCFLGVELATRRVLEIAAGTDHGAVSNLPVCAIGRVSDIRAATMTRDRNVRAATICIATGRPNASAAKPATMPSNTAPAMGATWTRDIRRIRDVSRGDAVAKPCKRLDEKPRVSEHLRRQEGNPTTTIGLTERHDLQELPISDPRYVLELHNP